MAAEFADDHDPTAELDYDQLIDAHLDEQSAILNLSRSDGPANNTTLEPWHVTFDELADALSKACVGDKDGSYFVRGPHLAPHRSDENILSADVLVIDGDKRIDRETGEIKPGAPSPLMAHEALQELGLPHVVYSTHSHDPDRQYYRWRAVIPCPMVDHAELLAMADHVVKAMQDAGCYVAYSTENGTWQQAWYFPRIRSADAPFEPFDGTDADPITREQVIQITAAWRAAREADRPRERPSAGRNSATDGNGPIGRFNAAYGNPEHIIELLQKHGYVFCQHDIMNGQAAYRLIRAGSESGIPGVHLYAGADDGRWLTFCHHAGDPLDKRVDGRQIALDAFDVYATLEHGDDKKKAAAAVLEHFREQDAQAAEETAASPDAFIAALQSVAAMEPIPAELAKIGVAETFAVPSYTVERSLGHLTKALRPPFPHPPDFRQLAATPEERRMARTHPRCIVHHYLYADLALLSAPGGTGKTTLILWECIHIVLGRPIYGLQVQNPGPVLIITAEDSREILLARLNCIMRDMQLSEAECQAVDNNLLIWDCSGELTRLVEVDEKGNLTPTGMADAIIERAKPIGPAMIILDPIVSFGPGESRINDGEQMLVTAARRMIRGLDCCIRYVTHTSQQSAKSGDMSQYAARGGTALSDGARMVAVLQQWIMDKDEAPPMTLDRGPLDRVLKLGRPKLSYAPPQELLWLARQEYTFSYATPLKVDEDQERKALADQVESFLVSGFKDGRKYTKNEIEEGQLINMPRAKFRQALAILLNERRVDTVALPQDEIVGARKSYLHPLSIPIPPKDDGGFGEKIDEKEAA